MPRSGRGRDDKALEIYGDPDTGRFLSITGNRLDIGRPFINTPRSDLFPKFWDKYFALPEEVQPQKGKPDDAAFHKPNLGVLRSDGADLAVILDQCGLAGHPRRGQLTDLSRQLSARAFALPDTAPVDETLKALAQRIFDVGTSWPVDTRPRRAYPKPQLARWEVIVAQQRALHQ